MSPLPTGSGDTGTKIKNFWQRKEGRTGMVLITALLGGMGLVAWSYILPFLITVTWNTLTLGIGLVALFLLSQIVLNGRIQTLAWYLIQMISRGLTSILWAVDPEGILEEYVKDRKRKQKRAVEQTERLRGVIKQFELTIERNKTEAAKEIQRAGAAKRYAESKEYTEEERLKMQYQFRLSASNAGMIRETNLTYEQLLKQLKHYYGVMLRLTEASEFVIRYTQNQVKQIILRRQGVQAASSAKDAVSAIIRGDAKTELYDETVEHLIAEMDQKLGEIDGFVDSAAGFLSKMDLDRGIFEEQALVELEKFGQKVDSIIASTDQDRMRQLGISTPEVGFSEAEISQGMLTQGGSRQVRSIADLIDDGSK